MADAGNCELDDALGKAAGIHQLAGQNEEGDRQQGKCVSARDHVLGDDLAVEHAHVKHEGNATEHQRKCHRYANGHGTEQRDDKDDKGHQARSTSFSTPWCSPAKAAISLSVTRPVTRRKRRSSAIRAQPAPVKKPMP